MGSLFTYFGGYNYTFFVFYFLVFFVGCFLFVVEADYTGRWCLICSATERMKLR